MLAEALRQRRKRVLVHLIDISPDALELSERTLGRARARLGRRPPRDLRGGPAPRRARAAAARERCSSLFLGSNIGNFDPPAADEFLAEIRAGAAAGRRAAARRRPRQAREATSCSPTTIRSGVTAAFNKNLLVRINTELLADFDLAAFAHRAVWNAGRARASRCTWSRSPTRRSASRAPTARCAFARGRVRSGPRAPTSTTPTRSSRMVDGAGFRCHQQWIEPDARFALTLFTAGVGQSATGAAPVRRVRRGLRARTDRSIDPAPACRPCARGF